MRATTACGWIVSMGLALSPRGGAAQPLDIPAEVIEAPVPAAPGTGVQAMFVLGFFAGQPYNLQHARDLLAGTSLTPSFDLWCGRLPIVDFTNGTTVDSLGRAAPTTQCLPFFDPASEQTQPCRPLPGLPAGTYSNRGGAVLRLRGWYAVRAPGTYTFAWGHDDGVAFDLGNVAVFAYPDGTAPRVDRRVVRFAAAGLYPFQLDWFDTVGNALLDWYVAPGEHPEGDLVAQGFGLVPTADLYPSDALPCTSDCQRCALPTPRCDHAASRCVACLDDRDCARATRCQGGVCAAIEAPDAGAAADLGRPVDAATLDVGVDAGAPAPPAGDGCGCRVGSTATVLARRGALASILLLALARRRATRRTERAPRR